MSIRDRTRSIGSRDRRPHERWETLITEFSDDVRLVDTVIFALPNRLVDYIQEYAPTFLEPSDVHFERRLRQLAGTGFYDRQPFACELLDQRDAGEVSFALFGDPVDEFFHEVRNSPLRSTTQTPDGRNIDLMETRREVANRTTIRLQGFAGWLVTNPEFSHEAVDLARDWSNWACRPSDCPDLKNLNSSAWTAADFDVARIVVDKAERFLRRWNLARMQTWDLPIPISPIQLTDDPLPRNEVQSMGVSLFIPWSLLAVKDLKLEELLDYHYFRQDLSHLHNWTSAGRHHSWGVDRLARMFQMYIYLECGIKRRYPSRMRRNAGKLDKAFRAFWGPPTADDESLQSGTDSVRKIREELGRRLLRCERRAQ